MKMMKQRILFGVLFALEIRGSGWYLGLFVGQPSIYGNATRGWKILVIKFGGNMWQPIFEQTQLKITAKSGCSIVFHWPDWRACFSLFPKMYSDVVVRLLWFYQTVCHKQHVHDGRFRSLRFSTANKAMEKHYFWKERPNVKKNIDYYQSQYY